MIFKGLGEGCAICRFYVLKKRKITCLPAGRLRHIAGINFDNFTSGEIQIKLQIKVVYPKGGPILTTC
jgi:hypothetical protein